MTITRFWSALTVGIDIEDSSLRHQQFFGGFIGVAACLAGPAFAEDNDLWQFSGELEIGVEAITDADDPDAEVRDIFFSAEIEAAFSLSERLSVFTEFTLESVTDPEADRAFEDVGLYFGELGLAFSLDPVTLSVGKVSPAFGSAWDTAPGYFGADLADEYETEEMIGILAELELGDGTLHLAAFYPDDTRLSDSFGTRRGRNTLEEGGVGNTGKINNFALQYDHDFQATTLHLGLRHLDQGQEDRDETGVALGVSHRIGEDIGLIAEHARFSGWEGEETTAHITTLGASIARGDFTWNAAASQLRRSDTSTDHLVSVGVDYEFDSGMEMTFGLARAREEGEDSTIFGLSVIVPFE